MIKAIRHIHKYLAITTSTKPTDIKSTWKLRYEFKALLDEIIPIISKHQQSIEDKHTLINKQNNKREQNYKHHVNKRVHNPLMSTTKREIEATECLKNAINELHSSLHQMYLQTSLTHFTNKQELQYGIHKQRSRKNKARS